MTEKAIPPATKRKIIELLAEAKYSIWQVTLILEKLGNKRKSDKSSSKAKKY